MTSPIEPLDDKRMYTYEGVFNDWMAVDKINELVKVVNELKENQDKTAEILKINLEAITKLTNNQEKLLTLIDKITTILEKK